MTRHGVSRADRRREPARNATKIRSQVATAVMTVALYFGGAWVLGRVTGHEFSIHFIVYSGIAMAIGWAAARSLFRWR